MLNYRSLRPLVFALNPENAHNLSIKALRSGLVPSAKVLNCSELRQDILGLSFPNVVGMAPGYDKNAEVMTPLFEQGFGFVEAGTVTPKPQDGNPKPRIFRLTKDEAIINRMGFNNLGLEEAVKKLKKRSNKLIIGGNIGKNTATPNEEALNDYVSCFNGLYDHVDYITVNVSCPNVTNLHKLQDQDELEKILTTLDHERAKKSIYKPVFLKVSPDLNTNQIDETLTVVDKCNVDGVIATNTTVTRNTLSINEDEIKRIANGGLSGLPIKDKSTEVIRYIANKTKGKLPIIGVGGIMTPQDALDKIEAGASLIQVYTGFIYEGPTMAKRINSFLKKRLQK